MKKLFIIFSFLLPLVGLAQDNDYIDWSAARRLNWDDYLARPNSQSDAAAITSTALGMEYHVKNNVLTFSITCKFSKTRSWVKSKTAHILGHEQGHFDITEIYARKLAKELSEYKMNPRTYQQDLDKLYKKIMKDKEKFQNEYDDKTDFSRNKEKQAEWLLKIKDELSDLNEYARYNGITLR